MSNTSVKPTIRKWLPRLLSGQPHQIIGGLADPYLLRWYVIPRNPLLNVYLHKFLRSDDDRALHDHPWWFVSLILRGYYMEVTDTKDWRTAARHRRTGSIAFRRAEWRHRVSLPYTRTWEFDREQWAEKPCWTLIITGRRVRTWGFWCKYRRDEHPTALPDAERFIPWQEFGDAGCGELP